MKILLAAAAALTLGAAPAIARTTAQPATGPAATQPHLFSAPVDTDVVTRMFNWWNQAIKDPNGFTTEAFGRYFTDDAILRINGTNRAKGLTDLAARFRKIQASVDAVEIHTPFVEAFSSPDGSKIFTYHLETGVQNGKRSESMVMGYVELRDGKIALVNFLSMEGQPGPMDATP